MRKLLLATSSVAHFRNPPNPSVTRQREALPASSMMVQFGSKGRGNGLDQRGDVGLFGLSVGWDAQVTEGLGGDGADGNT